MLQQLKSCRKERKRESLSVFIPSASLPLSFRAGIDLLKAALHVGSPVSGPVCYIVRPNTTPAKETPENRYSMQHSAGGEREKGGEEGE